HRAHRRNPANTTTSIHARDRTKIRCTNPHDGWRYVRFSYRRSPGFLCWAITKDQPIRDIDYVQFAQPLRKQEIKERPMAIVFCIDQIPRAFTTILRTKAKRRQKA